MACGRSITAPAPPPTLALVLAHRAIWAAREPAAYSYILTESGGFSRLAGRPFEVAVLHDTVQSVRFFDTGELVPGPYTGWPTIDGLFDQAVSAVEGSELTAIAFDRLLGYPTQMDFVPQPDRTQRVNASVLAN
jgi:hypothetical protein